MCEKCKQKIEARPYTGRPDDSYSVFESLLGQGFNRVVFVNTEMSCGKCQAINGYEWSLEEFMYDTDGPIYRKSHPNCLCYVQVFHPNGTVVNVNAQGEL
jgi:hypothetical protein